MNGITVLTLLLVVCACGTTEPASNSGEESGGTDAAPGEEGAEASGEDSDAAGTGEDLGADAESGEDIQDTASPPSQSRDELMAQTFGGDRNVSFHLPENVEGASDWPMVILLHGFSASGWLQDVYFNVSARVTELGFILLIPDGIPNADGQLFWNATDACCDWYGEGADDVAFLSDLIDEGIAKLPVDPKRVFLLGHSNGGFMSYRMACDAADRVAGIASIAGASWKDPSLCTPSEPVSVLQIHGTLDFTIPLDGDFTKPSAEESALQFVAHDGCDRESTSSDMSLDYDAVILGAETRVTAWTGCEKGSAVQLWTMEGTGHIPGFQPAFLADVMDFFLAHPKP